LQNGVDHIERVARLVDSTSEILPVVVQLPAEKMEPGRVEQSHDGALLVPDDAAGRDFSALFEGGRIRVIPVADFRTQAWWKLIANAGLGGVCALAIRDNTIVEVPGAKDLVLALNREVAEVGRAVGAKLPEDAPQKVIERMLAGAPGHWPSIAVDRREGRPMEWRVRNQVVCRIGRSHGVATPLNDALTVLLEAVDASPKGD